MPDFWFDHQDRNHDGHITPAELYADVVPPDITYASSMTLTLGGETVQLVFPGKNHADDGTVVFFPAERVVFSTDFPADALVTTSMRSLPSACGAFDEHPLSDWIASYRAIEALDFDILAQGHGAVLFSKADVAEGRRSFEDLDYRLEGGESSRTAQARGTAAVRAALASGERCVLVTHGNLLAMTTAAASTDLIGRRLIKPSKRALAT